MRALPAPPVLVNTLAAVHGDALTTVIGEPGDPTRTDVRPCEYVVTPSELYPGRPRVHVLVELDAHDREVLANRGQLLLSMDGGELPWSLDAVHRID